MITTALRLSGWQKTAILEKHLERLYSIRRNLAKTGDPTVEVEQSIQQVKSLIINLSEENSEEGE